MKTGDVIPYIRSSDGKQIGFAICKKPEDPPQRPYFSPAGWPDPAGFWEYHSLKGS